MLAQVSKISHIVNKKKLCCIAFYIVLISNLVKWGWVFSCSLPCAGEIDCLFDLNLKLKLEFLVFSTIPIWLSSVSEFEYKQVVANVQCVTHKRAKPFSHGYCRKIPPQLVLLENNIYILNNSSRTLPIGLGISFHSLFKVTTWTTAVNSCSHMYKLMINRGTNIAINIEHTFSSFFFLMVARKTNDNNHEFVYFFSRFISITDLVIYTNTYKSFIWLIPFSINVIQLEISKFPSHSVTIGWK